MDCSLSGSSVHGILQAKVLEWVALLHLYVCVCVCACVCMDFPGSSAEKESTCNAGDPSLIPGSGRSLGEGMGYPLQYSWIFLVAQMVKSLPVMQETWVRSLGLKDPLEEGKVSYSSVLVWRIPMDRGAGKAAVHEVTKSQTRLSD